jgi:hypothetical protein
MSIHPFSPICRYSLWTMSSHELAQPKKIGSKRPFTTLLGEHVGRDYAEFTDGRGTVRLWHFGNRIGVFESTGNLVGDHSRFIIEYFRKNIEAYERPWHAFGNWVALRAYTPEVRKSLTDWQVRSGYQELHVAHNSHLLAMSISVANAVLNNTVIVHQTEEQLDDVLNAVRKRHGL